MTLSATSAGTPAATHRARSRGARLRGGLVNVGLTAMFLAALGFLVPTFMGLERYVIMGGSMEGTYGLGSVVFEEVVPVEDLRVGDVITYVPPAESGIDTLVTHRIVDIDGSEFRTRGDANAADDPWTFQLTAATQPRAVGSVPYVGYVFMALADRSTRMAVLGIPAAIIALLSLVEVVRALRPGHDDDEPTSDEVLSSAATAAAQARPASAKPAATPSEPATSAPSERVPVLV